jgi:hypothetical protein
MPELQLQLMPEPERSQPLLMHEAIVISIDHIQLDHVVICVRAEEAPVVRFGGVTATHVVVVGSGWIQGRIPSSPGGACPTDVTVSYGAVILFLPGAFCYADFGV